MNANIKQRLTVMNFLEFAIWGAYLISMGRYLASAGFATNIGSFYAIQGVVSLFMPALMGIVADRWIPAQRLLALCHVIAGSLMVALYVYTQLGTPSYDMLFGLYTLSVAFYMPTLALSNSVAYTALEQAGLDLVKTFPPIRVFGTVGFICTEVAVSLLHIEASSLQFALAGAIGLVLSVYSLTLPECPLAPKGQNKGLVEALGLRAFSLFKQRKMALFFIFSMLLGICLQITNAFANPYISTFKYVDAYKDALIVKFPNIIIALSQASETLCILLIPFALKRFGIKRVMLISMVAWVLRFGLLGAGDPNGGVILFLLSMIVYGVAFDFFNVSGSLFVDKETDPSIRSSAQGLFMIMTNGIGATLGSLGAQAVLNRYVFALGNPEQQELPQETLHQLLSGWSTSWYVFAGYAAVVALLFVLLFRYKEQEQTAA